MENRQAEPKYRLIRGGIRSTDARRAEILQNSANERRSRVKSRREDILRDIVEFALQDDSCSNSANENTYTSVIHELTDSTERDAGNGDEIVTSKTRKDRKQRKRLMKLQAQRKQSVMDQIAFPEWMLQIPSNLAEWLICFPPIGLRCLVSSSR